MERDLVRRAQSGDHDAFATLTQDALDRLYGTARLILLDADRAHDATRDTLLTAWREIRGLRDPSGWGPWLMGALVRTCRRAAGTERGPSTGDVGESRQAFGDLAFDDRAILALVYFAEQSLHDAEVALGAPPGTADARRQEALDALRRALSLDDRPETTVDLEWRLRSWLAGEAAPPDLTELADEIADATQTTPQRRALLVGARGPKPPKRRGRRGTGRLLGAAVLTVSAVLVAVVGGVYVTRVIRPPDTAAQASAAPAGMLSPTGDISALAGFLDQPAIAVLGDGRVLIVGIGDTLIAGIVYDPATGTYGDAIRDPVLRRGSTATTLQNNLVLLTGGTYGGSDTPSPTTVLFDPVSETFATTNPMTIARAGQTATLLDDGRVLIAGGWHDSTRAGAVIDTELSAEMYDPATGTFTAIDQMTRARVGHTATKLRDGRILLAGGYPAPAEGPEVPEIFDPATGRFHPTGRMGTVRSGHSATLLADGRVLLVGGADKVGTQGESLHTLAGAEVFDPVTETFRPVGSLVTERTGHSATLLPDGRVLIAGGRNEVGEPHSTEIFDPAKGTFSAGPMAAAPHRATSAPLLANGRVLLAGSGPGASELFDPGAGVAVTASATPGRRPFSPVATSVMRIQPVLVELPDGKVLIFGGNDPLSFEQLLSAEIFDPSTGLSTPIRDARHRFSGTVTTRLPDGRVFIIGDAFNGTAAADIFEPATGTFVPASDETEEALIDRHAIQTVGLPDGHIVLTDYISLQPFDAATSILGTAVQSCEYPNWMIAIDVDRVLVTCSDQDVMVDVDLRTGTSRPANLRFERAIRLDTRRIALLTVNYDYLAGVTPEATDRITGVYDQWTRTSQSVAMAAKVGDATVIVGDRLLSFGGSLNGGPSASAVSIDTHSWATTDLGPMLATRAGASAIALRDGRILIVGGGRPSPDRSDPIPPGAELFDPSLVH